MEDKKEFHSEDMFFIAEAFDAIKNSIPIPPHTEKEFHDKDFYIWWTKLAAPAGGGGGQVFANAIFVDAIFGNDVNASKYTLADSTNEPLVHKFQTLDAAFAVAVPGDVVIVYPGDYVVTGGLFQDGVIYYFYPNARVFSNSVTSIFEDQGVGTACLIYGKGDFNNNGLGGVARAFTGGTIYLECNDIAALTNPVFITDGSIDVFCRDVVCVSNAAINIGGSGLENNRLYIRGRYVQTFSGAANNPTINCLAEDPGFQGMVDIGFQEIRSSPNSGNSVIFMQNFIVPVPGSVFNIACDRFVCNNNTNTHALIRLFFHDSASKINISGKMDLTLFPARGGFRINGPMTGSIVKFNGEILAIDNYAVLLESDGAKSYFDGIFSSSAPDTVITQNTNGVAYFDGEIINTPPIP